MFFIRKDNVSCGVSREQVAIQMETRAKQQDRPAFGLDGMLNKILVPYDAARLETSPHSCLLAAPDGSPCIGDLRQWGHYAKEIHAKSLEKTTRCTEIEYIPYYAAELQSGAVVP